jgi:hypothetical protein
MQYLRRISQGCQIKQELLCFVCLFVFVLSEWKHLATAKTIVNICSDFKENDKT